MNNSAQRPSPSSPHLQADNHEEAREGLDVTACSASSCVEEEVNGVRYRLLDTRFYNKETACSASSFAWDLGWDDDKKLLFKLMYKFASPEHRERANSDPEIANMAHDFAEIVTHRSDLKPGIESPSVSTFGKAKIES